VENRQLKEIEEKNDRALNIFRLTPSDKIFPHRISSNDVCDEKVVDLLELCSTEGSHYVLITHLRRLIRGQYSRHNGSTELICRRCLYVCFTDSVYERHRELCLQHKLQAVTLPRKDCPKGGDKFRYLKDSSPNSPGVTDKECMLPFTIFCDIG